MKPIEISPVQARNLALFSQGLLSKKPFAKREQGVLEAIQQISYVQIDTISIAMRAHHHTIWTRVPDYQPEMLLKLQAKDRTVFEYWSHAAAYLPMRDYRFSLFRKKAIRNGQKHWFEKNDKVMKYVIDRIKAEGPLQSKDFEAKDNVETGWGSYKPAKIALEQLFQEGKLMITERRKFQKVYDLPENIIPSDIDTSVPDAKEMARHLIEVGIHAHGLKADTEISYLRKGVKPAIKKALKDMTENGEIQPLTIKGLDQPVYYTFPHLLESLPSRIGTKQIHLINPFDNLVIQRKRLSQIFDFDYQIEVYVPQAKRKFGYYCLPILWGNEIIGRLDPKADRKSGLFKVIHLYLEKEVDWESIKTPLAKNIISFARFCGCEKVEIENASPKGFQSILEKEILEHL